MKKTWSILLALLLMVSMAACGGNGGASTGADSAPGSTAAPSDTASSDGAAADTASGEKIKIGVLITDYSDKNPSYVRTGFILHGDNKFKDKFEIIYANAELNPDKQIQQANDMITIGVEALCIYPVNGATFEPITVAAEEAGIPVITLCKQVENQQDVDAHSGASEFDTGKAQAEKVVEMLDGKGKVVVIKGKLGSDNTENRTKGYYDVLANYPDIEVVYEDTATWLRAEAMTLMENLIQSGVQFDAILANNDEMAIGAALAVQSAGLNLDDIVVSGIDGTPDCLDFIKEGLVDVSVYINPLLMSEQAMDLILANKTSGAAYEDKWIVPVVVTKDNVEDLDQQWKTVLDNVVTE